MFLHPRSYAVSEFARQHTGVIAPFPLPPEIAEGQYRHAECVETAAFMIAIALGLVPPYGPALVGDYLQRLVDDWHAHDPGGVSVPQGASSEWDATWWLQKLGATVDGNILPAGFDPKTSTYDWWGEMQRGIPAGYLYLVGVCNAQALPGDELGVHCHGLAALGVDDQGRLICGDPDNAHTQVNMPATPYGDFVAYTRQNFVDGDLSSLTRVHPMSLIPTGWKDDGTTLTAPNGKTVVGPFRAAILNSATTFGRLWNVRDVPQGPAAPLNPVSRANSQYGAGTRQVFVFTILCETPTRSVFQDDAGIDVALMEASLGTVQQQVRALQGQVTQLQAEVSALQAQLAASPSAAAIASAKSAAASLATAAASVQSAVGAL